MGNACRISSIDYSSDDESGGGGGTSRWIIILQAKGDVMKLESRGAKIKAGDVMLQHPHHFLCLASTILVRRKSKMIPAKATLQPGKIYLLLPLPDPEGQEHDQEEREGHEPLLPTSNKAEGTTKFIISKHYLDKILSESKQQGSSSRRSSIRRSAPIPQRRSSSSKRRSCESSVQRRSIVWSPALDSIPEK
ncbi:hypothetical protein SELMODRAFT_440323 [Selaginella moellendorffii]|uniref:DUF4228 domain-containing protein n=1 Tax=Selaginella moellendorffii TaxID=88036 RepID=D8RAZ4_SELML|nr:hypothetical protein SELMODRAFT_440323 [Selaginella moellendorffii]